MHQIICEYNELVSMIEYLIKHKYLNNKQDDDEFFIKNNKEFYNKYFISDIIKNTKQIIKKNNILEDKIKSLDELKTTIIENNIVELNTCNINIKLKKNKVYDHVYIPCIFDVCMYN